MLIVSGGRIIRFLLLQPPLSQDGRLLPPIQTSCNSFLIEFNVGHAAVGSNYHYQWNIVQVTGSIIKKPALDMSSSELICYDLWP